MFPTFDGGFDLHSRVVHDLPEEGFHLRHVRGETLREPLVVQLIDQSAIGIHDETQLRSVDGPADFVTRFLLVPPTEVGLEIMIEIIEAFQMHHVPGIHSRLAKAPLDEDVSGDGPIDHPVPENLDGHDLVIPEYRVVLLEDQSRSVEEQSEEVIVERDSDEVGFPGEVSLDQFADERIAQGDEVIPRGVERIDEKSGVTYDSPALRRIHLPTLHGVAFDRGEVLDQGFVFPQIGGELRLSLFDPGKHFFLRVESADGVQGFVGDDPDAGGTRGERDEPDPVAFPEEVVRALPAGMVFAEVLLPLLVRAPVVDLDAFSDSQPGRARFVRAFLLQAKLLLQKAGTPGRVDDPARVHLPLLSILLVVDDVTGSSTLEVDLLDARLIAKINSEGTDSFTEIVFKSPPVELIAGGGREVRTAQLESLVDLGIVFPVEEESQSHLGDLVVFEMLFEAEKFTEIVGAYFDTRFADLVSRLRDRMSAFFKNKNLRVGRFFEAVQCASETGKTSSEDGDVVLLRGWIHGMDGVVRGKPTLLSAEKRFSPDGRERSLTNDDLSRLC